MNEQPRLDRHLRKVLKKNKTEINCFLNLSIKGTTEEAERARMSVKDACTYTTEKPRNRSNSS